MATDRPSGLPGRTNRPAAISQRPAPSGPVRVLVVDDEVLVRRAVVRQLRDPRFEVREAEDGEVALEALAAGDTDLVLADVMMPRVSGLDLLRRVRDEGIDVEVIMMTANTDLQVAFEAVHAGAFHFLKKPFDTEELRLHVLRASERRWMLAHTRELEAELDGTRALSRAVGTSRALREVRDVVSRVAPLTATVLITGECGTGKEVIAREIHARSPRARKPFIAVNCGAFSEGTIEADLFGSVRGAFTGAEDRKGIFEAAEGGTVLLDEIGELPKGQQVRLLRVLQERAVKRVGEAREREVDVRILAATNVDIEAAVNAGRFRQDLFYRINVHTLELPPLRERREDIQLLAYHFLQKHGPQHNARVTRITPMALRALESYPWPGNVRELENAIVSGLGLARGESLEIDALPRVVRAAPLAAVPPRGNERATPTRTLAGADASLDYNLAKRRALDEFERGYFKGLMELTQNNISRAARLAGLDRSNFRRILRRSRADGEGDDLSGEGDELDGDATPGS